MPKFLDTCIDDTVYVATKRQTTDGSGTGLYMLHIRFAEAAKFAHTPHLVFLTLIQKSVSLLHDLHGMQESRGG